MLKIWKTKQTSAQAQKDQPRDSPAKIRLQKELGELETLSDTDIVASKDNIMEFTVVYRPREGLYMEGEFRFKFTITENYPHDPPKVMCLQRIFHPNIDPEGHICLNILREDWKPVLNIQSVIFGLQSLFLGPNADDPLNKDAAKMMSDSPDEFRRSVSASMRGRTVGGTSFDCVVPGLSGSGRHYR
ncbi:NEDD8-conjugating protein ubc12 [Coemansia sp. RSA 552]|nr:NEDD8-conjugating protein ubc12 [Coemansia sp. RSA 552]